MLHDVGISTRELKLPCTMQLRRMKVESVPRALSAIAILPIPVIINQKKSLEGGNRTQEGTHTLLRYISRDEPA